MMKKKLLTILYVILSAVVLAIGLVALSKCEKTSGQTLPGEVMDTTALLITQVRQCNRMYTAEVNVHKIITHDDELQLKGSFLQKKLDIDLPVGKRKVAIPMDATIKAYIDFENFGEANISRHGDMIEVTLPNPQFVMTHTKVRNEDVRKLVPLLRSDFTQEELEKYEAEGRAAIQASIPRLGLLESAREGGAKMLFPLLGQLGFKAENVRIVFSDEALKSFDTIVCEEN